MDTEKLKVYLEAISSGSLSAAAERLGYTPSGISRSIAALEEETGLTLLERGRRGVRPTADAEKLIPIMRDFLQQEIRYMDMAGSLRNMETGSITVGINYAAHFRAISGVLKKFEREYPGIELRTIQGLSSELTQALQEHKADFIIATKRPDFEFIRLAEDPMVACVPKEHPCTAKGIYPLQRFSSDPMIATYPTVDTDYKRALRDRGITPNVRYTSQNVYATYCMVEAGLGVFMSNRLEMKMYQGDAVLLPLDPPVLQEIGIMYRGEDSLSVSAKKLLQMIASELAEA